MTFRFKNDPQYRPRSWPQLAAYYPYTAAFIARELPTPENVGDPRAGYAYLGSVMAYCRRFGFAARGYGHCEYKSIFVYTGAPEYLRWGADNCSSQELLEYTLDVIFSHLEMQLTDLAVQGLPVEPEVHPLPTAIDQLMNDSYETVYLDFQDFAQGMDRFKLRQILDREGIVYLDWMMDRTLVRKHDLDRMRELCQPRGRNLK